MLENCCADFSAPPPLPRCAGLSFSPDIAGAFAPSPSQLLHYSIQARIRVLRCKVQLYPIERRSRPFFRVVFRHTGEYGFAQAERGATRYREAQTKARRHA